MHSYHLQDRAERVANRARPRYTRRTRLARRSQRMPIDQHGLELTGSAEAVEHYDRAIHELLHFREGVIDEARSAYQADPTFPMGNALRAYLRLLSSEPDDAAAASEPFERFRASVPADRLLPRQRGHVEAVAAWLDGRMRGAGQILAEVTRTHPRHPLPLP